MRAELKGIVCIVFVPLIFFWRELMGLSFFAGFDFTHLILPLHKYARDAINAGHFPHWNPYMFAGFPQHAEGEGGIFYPLNFPFYLPGDQAYAMSWVIVIHLIVAGLLMYAFLRGRGTISAVSIWISLFYQYTPAMLLRFETVGLFQAMCWLPGFFWAIEQSVKQSIHGERRADGILSWAKWSLIASIFLSMMMLAGSSQIAFYAMIGAVFFLGGVAAEGPESGVKTIFSVGTLIVAVILGLGLSAVQLIPTSFLADLSYRLRDADFEYYRMGTWLNVPRLASLFLFPAVKEASDFLDYISSLGYIGILPFVLVIVALSVHRRHMNPILAPFFLMFFGFILAFGMNFMANRDLLNFPGFGLFRAMGRMILPVQVALFALSAVGLESILRANKHDEIREYVRSGLWISGFLFVLLFLWRLFYEGWGITALEIYGYSILVISLIIVLLFLKLKTELKSVALTVWVIFHLIYLTPIKNLITVEKTSWRNFKTEIASLNRLDEANPERPPRYLISTRSEPWDALMKHLYDSPSSPMNSLPTSALGNELSLAGIGVANAYTPLISWRWYYMMHDYASRGMDQVRDASVRLRNTLSISDIDGIISPETFRGGDDFSRIDTVFKTSFPFDYHALEFQGAVPFASIPKTVEAWDFNDWEIFKHFIVRKDYMPGETVVVEIPSRKDFGFEWKEPVFPEESTAPIPPEWGEYSVQDDLRRDVIEVTRDYNEITIKVEVSEKSFVVVRESYFPGWEVSVDGNKAEIFQADFLFCAIPVDAGEHEIVMKYETPGFQEGAKISGIVVGIWILMMTGVLITRKFRKT